MRDSDLSRKYGIMSVPTLIVDPSDPESAITGVSQIIGWANANGMRA